MVNAALQEADPAQGVRLALDAADGRHTTAAAAAFSHLVDAMKEEGYKPVDARDDL